MMPGRPMSRSPMSHAPVRQAAFPEAPVRQVVGIDAIRFAAAVIVMLFHLGFWFTRPGQALAGSANGAPPIFRFGWCGVEIFFVISGVVISYSAEGVGVGRFVRHRVLRLVPAAWICTTVSCLIYFALGADPAALLLRRALMTFAFWPFAAIDGVYWTLGVEISFYAVVALVLAGVVRVQLETAMIVIGLGSTLFWIGAFVAHAVLAACGARALVELVDKVEAARILQLLLVQHGCFFALGVLMHEAALRRRLSTGRALVASGLLVGCALEIVGKNAELSRLSRQALPPAAALVTFAAGVALIAASIAFNEAIARRIGSRGVRTSRALGRMTYPLYLLHSPVGLAVALPAAAFGRAALVLASLVAIAAALLVERYPERALRRALREWPWRAARGASCVPARDHPGGSGRGARRMAAAPEPRPEP